MENVSRFLFSDIVSMAAPLIRQRFGHDQALTARHKHHLSLLDSISATWRPDNTFHNVKEPDMSKYSSNNGYISTSTLLS